MISAMKNDSQLVNALQNPRFRSFADVLNYVQVAVFVACFLANLLTITSFVRFENLHRKPSYILILSLSIADGLLGKCKYDYVLQIMCKGPRNGPMGRNSNYCTLSEIPTDLESFIMVVKRILSLIVFCSAQKLIAQ